MQQHVMHTISLHCQLGDSAATQWLVERVLTGSAAFSISVFRRSHWNSPSLSGTTYDLRAAHGSERAAPAGSVSSAVRQRAAVGSAG